MWSMSAPAAITMKIDILPDDVLLHIFHLIRVVHLGQKAFSAYKERDFETRRLSWWHPLAHVCRRWRSIVFASRNFLDLKLVCGPRTRMELIGIWPPLPIIIRNEAHFPMPEDYDFDIATMHHWHNRVCEINLHLAGFQLQRLAPAMQEQFPALTHLTLECPEFLGPSLALPDGFLNGPAPTLQYLALRHIPFPALPKLLLSATNLVHLSFWDTPHSGYISPKVIVTALATLVNLKTLIIGFESPLSCSNRETRRPPPLTRTVLPALTRFTFRGVSEYLEDLVACIDAPLLDYIRVFFFHQLLFSIPQLAQFMRRTTTLKAPNEAHVDFSDFGVCVRLFSQRGAPGQSILTVSCTVLEWQLSSLAQLFLSFFPSIHTVEHLYIHTTASLPLKWQDDLENIQWLDFFRPFTAVKNLYVSKYLYHASPSPLHCKSSSGKECYLPRRIFF